MMPSKSTSSTTSRRSNRDDIVDTLKNIDPHKLDILEHRIRGNQEGGIESHSFTPPRSIISPAITSGGYAGGRHRRSGSVSNLTTATSDGEGNKIGGLLSGDDKSNLNAVTFEEHAASNASCQTVQHANSTKKRKQQDNNSKLTVAAGSGKKEGKKKSTPSKRKVSAIGQLTAANNNKIGNASKSKKKGKTETITKATANGKSSSGGGQKKRRVKKSAAGEDTSSKSAIETGNSRSANSRSGAPSSKSQKQSSSANSTSAAASATTGTAEESRDTLYSYFGNASNPAVALGSSGSNHSRSCSSPPALQSKKEKTGNQRTLHSFLGISSKKKQQQQDVNEDDGDKKLGEKVTAKEGSGEKDETTSRKPATKKKRASLKSTTPIADTTATTNSDQSSEIKQLHNQLSTLQKQLQDAKARNDSIKNNQTLLSTNLQRQLKNQKVELEKVRNDSDTKMTKAMEVMEKLVRDESIRESNELRQKLASDGARLGRLVSSRISSGNGMRSQIIESWEDGSAPTAIKMKREELRVKRDELERRKDELRRGVYLPQESTTDNDNGDDSEDDTLDGNDDSLTESRESTNNESNSNNDNANVDSSEFMMNDLDRLEAHETVRVRLDEVRKEEAELDRQERALNIEKRGHLRSLKLVANEDSSKWRNERKLHERYVLMNLLGKGGFSEVWRAFDLEDMRNVAVKIHQVESSWSDSKKENYTKHVAREFEIHQVVRHPRIVSLFDVFEIDDDTFATVLECCKGTDLDTTLKDRGRLPERDARAILMQILSGMRYLSTPSTDGERQGIIHYDLKPGNILFDEKGNAKITDFGLSKIVDDNEDGDSMELTSQGAGTYWYLPPECFLTEQDVRISNKVDVWSIGVIYFQMLYGRRPFGDGQSQDHILRHQTMLQATEVNFPSKPSITDQGKAFIRHCLTYEQMDRPTVGEVCEHEYLKLTSL